MLAYSGHTLQSATGVTGLISQAMNSNRTNDFESDTAVNHECSDHALGICLVESLHTQGGVALGGCQCLPVNDESEYPLGNSCWKNTN